MENHSVFPLILPCFETSLSLSSLYFLLILRFQQTEKRDFVFISSWLSSCEGVFRWNNFLRLCSVVSWKRNEIFTGIVALKLFYPLLHFLIHLMIAVNCKIIMSKIFTSKIASSKSTDSLCSFNKKRTFMKSIKILKSLKKRS